jgi:hypothetical protein
MMKKDVAIAINIHSDFCALAEPCFLGHYAFSALDLFNVLPIVVPITKFMKHLKSPTCFY